MSRFKRELDANVDTYKEMELAAFEWSERLRGAMGLTFDDIENAGFYKFEWSVLKENKCSRYWVRTFRHSQPSTVLGCRLGVFLCSQNVETKHTVPFTGMDGWQDRFIALIEKERDNE